MTSLLAHPIRREILQTMAEHEPIGAAEIARSLDIPLNKLSYHMKVLRKQGLIEVILTERRRNAIACFYARTDQLPEEES